MTNITFTVEFGYVVATKFMSSDSNDSAPVSYVDVRLVILS